MKRSSKQMLTLCVTFAVLLIAIAAYAVIGHVKNSEKVKEDKKDSSGSSDLNIYNAGIKNLKSFTYKNKYNNVTIVKDGNEWKVKGNEDFPLNQTDALTMANTAATVDSKKVVSTDGNISEFGLDKPLLKLTVKTTDDKKYKLLVGQESIAAGGRYAYLKGKKEIYVVSSDVYNSFKYSREDLLATEDFPEIYADYVTDYQYNVKKGKDFEAVYDLDDSEFSKWNNWKILKAYPRAVPGRRPNLRYLFNTFGSLDYKKCVSYGGRKEDFKKYGLKDPRISISVTFRYYKTSAKAPEDTPDPDAKITTEKFTLNIGNQSDNGKYYYVNPEGSDRIYTMDAVAMKDIVDMKYRDYVYQSFYQTEAGVIKNVKLVSGKDTSQFDIDSKEKKTFVLETAAPGEKETPDPGFSSHTFSVSSDGKSVDSDKFMSEYAAFKNIVITGEYDKNKDKKTVMHEVTFTNKDGEETDIRFIDYKGDNFYAVSVDGKSPIFLADRNVVDDQFKDMESLAK